MFFIHDDEAKRAHKHADKRIIYSPPFWNKVYSFVVIDVMEGVCITIAEGEVLGES